VEKGLFYEKKGAMGQMTEKECPHEPPATLTAKKGR